MEVDGGGEVRELRDADPRDETEYETGGRRGTIRDDERRAGQQACRRKTTRSAGKQLQARLAGANRLAGLSEEAHADRYGYRRDETPVEAVTLRVIVTAPAAALVNTEHAPAKGPPPLRAHRVFFEGGEHEAGAVWRHDLRAGHRLEGPLVVQEYSGTTWLPPGWTMDVDGHGTLHLSRHGAPEHR